jgi:hypothetical protein
MLSLAASSLLAQPGRNTQQSQNARVRWRKVDNLQSFSEL